MVFAEDYDCQNNDEVQNAYFSAGNVTIFPAVVYYRDAESAELLVKSIAFISDEGSHDSYAVHAILDKLLPIVKQFVPDLKQVFYWTDSPTSQFRNKTIFHIISEHKGSITASQVGTISRPVMARVHAMKLEEL